MYIDGSILYVNIGRLREKLEKIGASDVTLHSPQR